MVVELIISACIAIPITLCWLYILITAEEGEEIETFPVTL